MSHRILNIVAIIFLLATLQIHASFLGGRSSTSKMLEKLQNVRKPQKTLQHLIYLAEIRAPERIRLPFDVNNSAEIEVLREIRRSSGPPLPNGD